MPNNQKVFNEECKKKATIMVKLRVLVRISQ